jgi:hypothetical protein
VQLHHEKLGQNNLLDSMQFCTHRLCHDCSKIEPVVDSSYGLFWSLSVQINRQVQPAQDSWVCDEVPSFAEPHRLQKDAHLSLSLDYTHLHSLFKKLPLHASLVVYTLDC